MKGKRIEDYIQYCDSGFRSIEVYRVNQNFSTYTTRTNTNLKASGQLADHVKRLNIFELKLQFKIRRYLSYYDRACLYHERF